MVGAVRGAVRVRFDRVTRHDRHMPESDSQDVETWFAQRGFMVLLSDTDYAEQVRRSPWGRKAPSRNHHVWVDLLASDGRLVQGGYGSGDTPNEAMRRARERYKLEQERGSPAGPRGLP
jgi:hypothetical protein